MPPRPRLLPLDPRIVLLAATTLACSAPDTPLSPSVILISVDTLRSDHLGCYGYTREVSPNIDELARRGVVFENAISTSSWTLPAHATMLTGLYPAFHALQDDGVKLPPEVGTLAEVFRERGYRTFAAVSHVYVSSRFGLERGFDEFDDSLIAGGRTNPIAEQVVDRFLEQLERAGERPFFGFLHLFDPHWPYRAPQPFGSSFTDPSYSGPIDGSLASLTPFFDLRRPMPDADLEHTRALYDGEIAYVDDQIGRLLRALETMGVKDDTVIVVTSDHGEEFKEHRGLGHGRTLFGEQLRVPLIVAGSPRLPAGTRRSELVSAVDLLPTLLDLIGASPAGELHGVSLLSDTGPRQRSLFAESIRFGIELRAIRIGPFKLIHYLVGDQRLHFDLREDAGELYPDREDPTGGALSAALADYAATADSGWHLKVVAATREPLRLVGKVTTTGRLVGPRRYFSEHVGGHGRVEFLSYETDPGGKSLRFELRIVEKIGALTFDTDPPDAPVTFEVRASGPAAAGVFAGAGEVLANGEPITLERDDARLRGVLGTYAESKPGLYIRTVTSRRADAPPADLPEEVLERLRSLGYVDAGTRP